MLGFVKTSMPKSQVSFMTLSSLSEGLVSAERLDNNNIVPKAQSNPGRVAFAILVKYMMVLN